MLFVDFVGFIFDGLIMLEFVLRLFVVVDVEFDYVVVMESCVEFCLWEQIGWLVDDFMLVDDLVDVEFFEQCYFERWFFIYIVIMFGGMECLGCVYVMLFDVCLFMLVEISLVGDCWWIDYCVVIYFWVCIL